MYALLFPAITKGFLLSNALWNKIRKETLSNMAFMLPSKTCISSHTHLRRDWGSVLPISALKLNTHYQLRSMASTLLMRTRAVTATDSGFVLTSTHQQWYGYAHVQGTDHIAELVVCSPECWIIGIALKWSRPQNDPKTWDDPQINPKKIPPSRRMIPTFFPLWP